MTDEPKLYSELASWFHLLTDPADYAEEAELYRRLLVEACDAPPETVLELGSGGGNNASHLKQHFRLTLTDRSPQMLALGRSLNPACEHVLGDMRSVRLGRSFEHEDFWRTVVHFFVNHPELDLAHVAPIVEYLHGQRFVVKESFMNVYSL